MHMAGAWGGVLGNWEGGGDGAVGFAIVLCYRWKGVTQTRSGILVVEDC